MAERGEPDAATAGLSPLMAAGLAGVLGSPWVPQPTTAAEQAVNDKAMNHLQPFPILEPPCFWTTDRTGKGDRHLLPERPFGVLPAQKVPVPFSRPLDWRPYRQAAYHPRIGLLVQHRLSPGAAKFLSPGSSATRGWGAGIVMVHGRWFNFAVFSLWLAAMGWLFWVKIRPELMVGDPPNENTILAAQRFHPTNGWAVFWNNRKIGWAVNTTVALPKDLTEIDSTIHIDSLPLNEIIPRSLKGYLSLGVENVRIPVEAVSERGLRPAGKALAVHVAAPIPRHRAVQSPGHD